MPKSLYFPPAGNETSDPFDRSGIEIRFTPTANRVDVSGWYDHCVGIEGGTMTLGAFFTALGITEAHCRKAFKVGHPATGT